MIWRIGMKVVALTDFHNAARFGLAVPRKNGVYTIRAISEDGGWLCLLLAEVVNAPAYCLRLDGRTVWAESCWEARAFRPLVAPDVDIGVFERLLDDVNQMRRVDA